VIGGPLVFGPRVDGARGPVKATTILTRIRAGAAAGAEAAYREARDLAAALAMRPLVAHCHLGLVGLYGRTGKGHQAREHLATATAMYRELGMRSWLQQAGREAGGLA